MDNTQTHSQRNVRKSQPMTIQNYSGPWRDFLERLQCVDVPDAVSSCQDPLVRDQSASAGVPPFPLSVVLQRDLEPDERRARADLIFNVLITIICIIVLRQGLCVRVCVVQDCVCMGVICEHVSVLCVCVCACVWVCVRACVQIGRAHV